MSETLKPETAAMVEELSHDEDSYYERMINFADSMESDRNRWRIVAEQAEKALNQIRKQTTDGHSTALYAASVRSIAKTALAAFDSLRKEGQQ